MSAKFNRIPVKDYKKLLFQARGQYLGILNVFRCYGMDTYADQAVEECMKVTENFGQAVRGDPTPIHIMDGPRRRVTE